MQLVHIISHGCAVSGSMGGVSALGIFGSRELWRNWSDSKAQVRLHANIELGLDDPLRLTYP